VSCSPYEVRSRRGIQVVTFNDGGLLQQYAWITVNIEVTSGERVGLARGQE
jgi:hypothetical protein